LALPKVGGKRDARPGKRVSLFGGFELEGPYREEREPEGWRGRLHESNRRTPTPLGTISGGKKKNPQKRGERGDKDPGKVSRTKKSLINKRGTAQRKKKVRRGERSLWGAKAESDAAAP